MSRKNDWSRLYSYNLVEVCDPDRALGRMQFLLMYAVARLVAPFPVALPVLRA